MDVIALLKQVEASYRDVEAKAAAKDAAGSAYHEATVAHRTAADGLSALQSELNAILGKAADDPRVRMG